jgi:Histidine-specific methyltransferase, SAM-dependent
MHLAERPEAFSRMAARTLPRAGANSAGYPFDRRLRAFLHSFFDFVSQTPSDAPDRDASSLPSCPSTRRGASAIEMHLVSRGRQRVCVGRHSFEFADGETIHTESSRKYDLHDFARTVENQGWTMSDVWSDDDNLFGVFGLRAAPLRSRAGAPARRAATWRATA